MTFPSIHTTHTRVRDIDANIRPSSLDTIIGQATIKRTLGIAIRGAQARNEPLDHVLLTGPAGLGKTTLASLIATETNAEFRRLEGPQIDYSYIVQLCAEMIGAADPSSPTPASRFVIFIDEIHGLKREAIVHLLPLIEDFTFEGFAVPPFTLVGATTNPERLPAPFRERFRIRYHLEFYPDTDIARIARRSLEVLTGAYTPDPGTNPSFDLALKSLAIRSGGIPRHANYLVRHTLDYMLPDESEIKDDPLMISPLRFVGQLPNYKTLTPEILSTAMRDIGIDNAGLSEQDRRMLEVMTFRLHSKPASLRSIAAAMGESALDLEATVEPNLVRRGFIDRTPTGRQVTATGIIVAANQRDGKVKF